MKQIGHGRYLLIRALGSGGTAEVYEARDQRLDRPVAIKLLHRRITENPELFGRLKEEVDFSRLLKHRSIVDLLSVESDGDQTFVVLELLEGGDLRQRVLLRGPLPAGETHELASTMLDALDHAHQNGVIHRDIKPRNILFTKDGEPKLTDFGLAQSTFALTTSTNLAIAGTPEYTAPESITSGLYDTRTDIYALGATLYESLTGKPPFTGNAPAEVLRAQVEDPAPLLPQAVHAQAADLAMLIERMLAKNPNERPQTCREAAKMLGGGYRVPAHSAVRQQECMHCGAGIDPEYPWCFACHRPTLMALPDKKEGVAIVVTGPGKRAEKLSADLRDSIVEVVRGYGLVPNTIGKTLPRVPFVLIRGIERSSSDRLLADLQSRGIKARAIGTGLPQRRTLSHVFQKATAMTPRYWAVLAGMSGLLVNVVFRLPFPAILTLAIAVLVGTPAAATVGFSRAQIKWPKNKAEAGPFDRLLVEVKSPLIHARVHSIRRAADALRSAAVDDPLLTEEDRDVLESWLDRLLVESAELGRELHRVREGRRYATAAGVLPSGELATARPDGALTQAVSTARELDQLEHRVLERLSSDALLLREIAVRAAAGGVAALQSASADLKKMVERLVDERSAWEEMGEAGDR